jgi:hypothetical protein
MIITLKFLLIQRFEAKNKGYFLRLKFKDKFSECGSRLIFKAMFNSKI